MNKKKIFIILVFLITGCKKNNPILFENFQALRCLSNINEKIYNDYIFNVNTGYLYFYNDIKDDFIPIGERNESGLFSENTKEIFSIINNNNLFITNIEYYKDSDKNQKIIRKQEIINLKSLVRRSIIKNKSGDNVVSIGKCTWIDPKLGLRY